MVLEHVKFSFDVELVSDTHIGAGEHAPLKALRPNVRFDPNSDEAAGEVATLVRDHQNRPTLPSTALKGALRKVLLRQMSRDEVEALFGTVKSETDGAMGQFAFYAGELLRGDRYSDSQLPYWDREKLSWIATRVAISRRHGAAEHKKLFSKEMIPSGSVFRIAGVWFSTLERALIQLPRLLAPFAASEGLSVGAGTRLGQGAIRFLRSGGHVSLQQVRFAPETGNVEDRTIAEPLVVRPIAADEKKIDIKLFCPGPFLSVDAAGRGGANDRNTLSALKRNDKTPVLYLSSIAGALRSRAAWISARHGLGEDDRFRKPSSWKTVTDLSPVERLFGVSGWRGLLRLSHTEPMTAKGQRILMSNSLDRFSGAVLDGSLFGYEVFTDVALNLSLTLEHRRDTDGQEVPLQTDKELFHALLDDLKDDVLMLGHATNRGFGWFDVRSIDPIEAA